VPIDDTLINRARCSVKLLELMAAGLPLVASRVGEVAEYIEDRQSGLLVAPKDSAALAEAILLLLSDQALRIRIGIGARQRAAESSWDKLALIAEASYRSAAAIQAGERAIARR
jgi:glycosyltransferase involved in cell wall biosynthesis